MNRVPNIPQPQLRISLVFLPKEKIVVTSFTKWGVVKRPKKLEFLPGCAEEVRFQKRSWDSQPWLLICEFSLHRFSESDFPDKLGTYFSSVSMGVKWEERKTNNNKNHHSLHLKTSCKRWTPNSPFYSLKNSYNKQIIFIHSKRLTRSNF